MLTYIFPLFYAISYTYIKARVLISCFQKQSVRFRSSHLISSLTFNDNIAIISIFIKQSIRQNTERRKPFKLCENRLRPSTVETTAKPVSTWESHTKRDKDVCMCVCECASLVCGGGIRNPCRGDFPFKGNRQRSTDRGGLRLIVCVEAGGNPRASRRVPRPTATRHPVPSRDARLSICRTFLEAVAAKNNMFRGGD